MEQTSSKIAKASLQSQEQKPSCQGRGYHYRVKWHATSEFVKTVAFCCCHHAWMEPTLSQLPWLLNHGRYALSSLPCVSSHQDVGGMTEDETSLILFRKTSIAVMFTHRLGLTSLHDPASNEKRDIYGSYEIPVHYVSITLQTNIAK